MQVKSEGNSLATELVRMLPDAANVTVRTVDGAQVTAYEPITLGPDHLSFSSAVGSQSRRVFMPWASVAYIMV